MSTPWWQSQALGFDTETTGLDVHNERIVDLALVTVGNGKPTREGGLINPGIEIPAAATAIHRITTERAQTEGRAPAEALDAAAETIVKVLSDGLPVIGMNIVYDLSLFHMDCLRNGVPTLSRRLGGHHAVRPIVDISVIDKHVSWRKGKRRLPDLCTYYGVKHHGAHDCGYDALAAALVLEQMVRRNQKIAERWLNVLHDDQVAWKAEQNASLQEHKRRETGDPHLIIPTGWPLYDSVIAADPAP